MKLKPRVRFAPSPTGVLHLGGVRTALFNYLFSRQKGGSLFLRIEDTDVKRSRQEFVDQICDSLKWLGLSWEGPIVFQSQRTEHHLRIIRKLLQEGSAYRCFCTVDELRKEREEALKNNKGYQYSKKCRDLSPGEIKMRLNCADQFCIRIKIPRGKSTFNDLIYGKITVLNKDIDDFIIQRSDGNPTYNLTVIVDDSDMEITHVIRGEDHLTNTTKQIVIYRLLGRKIPTFVHLPMILGPDQKRLSKRHGALGLMEYRDLGYLPQALLNYLSLLGWNPDTEKEMYTLEELIGDFLIEQVQKKPAIYDEQKLLWMNKHHMEQISSEELLKRIRELVPDWQIEQNSDYLITVLDIQKQRLKTVREITDQSIFFFEDPVEYDPKSVKKRWKDESVSRLVREYIRRLSPLDVWNGETVELELRRLSEEREVKTSQLIHTTRLAITGVPHGPSLFLIMELLGKETCLRRLQNALNRLQHIEITNEYE